MAYKLGEPVLHVMFFGPETGLFVDHELPGCRNWLTKLIAAGASQDVLALFLAQILRPTRPIRLYPEGIEWRTLKRLPQRIESMADQIAKVTEHYLLRPQGWPSMSGRRIVPAKGQTTGRGKQAQSWKWTRSDLATFASLPDYLMNYGRFLRYQLIEIGKLQKHPVIDTGVVVGLLDYVRERTKSPHYDALSFILQQIPTTDDVTSKSLKDLYCRHRRLRPYRPESPVVSAIIKNLPHQPATTLK